MLTRPSVESRSSTMFGPYEIFGSPSQVKRVRVTSVIFTGARSPLQVVGNDEILVRIVLVGGRGFAAIQLHDRTLVAFADLFGNGRGHHFALAVVADDE